MEIFRDQEYRFHALAATSRDLDNFVAYLRSVAELGTVIRVVRGSRMESKELLLDEFAAAFQFPMYFGRNWDAFEECMADLQWLPGKAYLLIISNASSLLKLGSKNDSVIFFKILNRISQQWANGELPNVGADRDLIPFQTVLQDSASGIQELIDELLPIVGEIPRISVRGS